MDLNNHTLPKERIFYLNICELNLNKRIENNLKKIGINTVSDLSTKTRIELMNSKLFGVNGVDAIANALMKYGVHLLNDEFYSCHKCRKRFVGEISSAEEHYCRICNAKLDRVSKISDFSISLTGPEYANYTRIGDGFALYANIQNETEELQKVKFTEFYLVSHSRERAPASFLTGYVFEEEKIMPMTSKCCSKIWALSSMDGKRLEVNDYVLITIVSNFKEYMFKFDFDGVNWLVDDYWEK